MSDMADILYNAWSSCTGPVTYQLYCFMACRQCAWQTNLTKIQIKDKHIEVYKFLKVLQGELDKLKFEKRKWLR